MKIFVIPGALICAILFFMHACSNKYVIPKVGEITVVTKGAGFRVAADAQRVGQGVGLQVQRALERGADGDDAQRDGAGTFVGKHLRSVCTSGGGGETEVFVPSIHLRIGGNDLPAVCCAGRQQR